jgi:glycerol kinase
MGKQYILSIDQSTSASKAILVDDEGNILTKASKEHKQYYPQPGWVEHDPIEIYKNVLAVAKSVVEGSSLSPEDIRALSITNQRETVLLWDRSTGEPIYNAIVWQCRRTTDICQQLVEQGVAGLVKNKTGLKLDPYFSATKIKWILDNVDGAKEKAGAGNLLIGTIDSWLIWKLSGGKVHATDYTNASRTLLFNIKELDWDQKLIKLFSIQRDMLPEIKSSNDIFADTDLDGYLEKAIPITGVIGDSQAALFGQKCFDKGMVKATYGTGTSILMQLGDKFVESENGLVTSIAWGIDQKIEYALEGIINTTGDTLKWLRDNLALYDNYDEIEQMTNKIDDNQGVYLVPAFVGLGAPYWDANARAVITGMSRDTGRQHILRAAVEAIAYQINDVINLMRTDSALSIKELRVDGGATSNSFLMQFQADITGTRVVRSEIAELSAMGSVYLAGLGVGIWKSTKEISSLNRQNKVFLPALDEKLKEKYYQGWKDAVSKALTK